MESSVDRARNFDRTGRRLRVLVLVKASPQPSSTYGDTVCVAGVVIEPGPPRWVRLYPVPFRYLSGERKFSKYDILDVAVRRAGRDQRPESLKIDASSLDVGESLRGWKRRAPWVEPLAGPTMCELIDNTHDNLNAVSLAAIRPKVTHGLRIDHHPGWTEKQLARFARYAAQGDLFSSTPPRLLDPPRFAVRLRYDCCASECHGHEQTLIDWELTALQHRHRGMSDEELSRLINERFFENMFREGRLPLLFVGNQEDVRRRSSFTVLGAYYPEFTDVPLTETLW